MIIQISKIKTVLKTKPSSPIFEQWLQKPQTLYQPVLSDSESKSYAVFYTRQ